MFTIESSLRCASARSIETIPAMAVLWLRSAANSLGRIRGFEMVQRPGFRGWSKFEPLILTRPDLRKRGNGLWRLHSYQQMSFFIRYAR